MYLIVKLAYSVHNKLFGARITETTQVSWKVNIFLSELMPYYICLIPYPHLLPKVAMKNKNYEMNPTELNLYPKLWRWGFCALGGLCNINRITLSKVWQIMVFFLLAGFIISRNDLITPGQYAYKNIRSSSIRVSSRSNCIQAVPIKC